jgi:hypothetical protein
MPGSAYMNTPSYLPTLMGSGAPGSNSLLAILHGSVGAAHGTVNPIAAMEHPLASEALQVALIAADPRVKHDILQFTQALATAKTPAQLLANPAALKVLLTASGLGDRAGDIGLATRALLSDPAQSDSLVNTLVDRRWLSLNKICSFTTGGLSALNHPETTAALVEGYAEAVWRANLDQAAPGLTNALDLSLATPGLAMPGLAAPTARSVGLIV